MNRFSRLTIVKAFDLLKDIYQYHNQVDRFRLLFGFEDIGPQGAVDRATKLLRILEYLIRNPDAKGPNGSDLVFEVIEYIIGEAKNRYSDYLPDEPQYMALENSLKRDGYIIDDNKLRMALPEIVELPEKENELISLLDKFGFKKEKGHLDQAIASHARGDWASANGQIRTFLEGLFDSIAESLASDKGALPAPGAAKRAWLSQLDPPFLRPDLNEWRPDSKGFVEALFKRLHPEGSHPGLSDEEDSTFRLHFVILTSLYYLRRLHKRT